jgi:3-oxoacyl-[acyl-carrier-protein] synthase II
MRRDEPVRLEDEVTKTMSSTRRRVVVTGMGAICPVGNTIAEMWQGLISGRSGIRPITRFDAGDFETRFAGEVDGFDPAVAVGRKESRRMDRYTQFAVASALQAADSAGLSNGAFAPERAGVLIGTGMGAMETLEQGAETLAASGPRRLSPFFAPMVLPNMAAGMTAIHLGAKGPCVATASACASSGHAIGEAARMIRDCVAEVMFAGGSEAPITKLGVGGFNAMDALSTRNDDPQGASRPFDAGRDGFVLAEGGAVIVLEERDHAIARGATILAELFGYGSTDDANHIVQPAPGGEGIARAIRIALDEAGLQPADIDYVNAHGTSTQLNEKFETMGMKAALGDAAYRIPVSSTKSMTGHLLGAAGSLEAAIGVQAIQSQCLPPTINYETPDPDCDLDYIPNTARPAAVRNILSNSMGFGGHNVALIFGAYTE